MCKKHPKYKGIRKPRVDCLACWSTYNEKSAYQPCKIKIIDDVPPNALNRRKVKSPYE